MLRKDKSSFYIMIAAIVCTLLICASVCVCKIVPEYLRETKEVQFYLDACASGQLVVCRSDTYMEKSK